jgi:20S proteasome alpha/beta subunit
LENKMQTIVKFAKYSALAVVVGLASGCATSETTKMIEENKQTAEEATNLANQALKAAAEASRKADAAMTTAQMAERCCTESQEMIDEKISRSFEKGMHK